MQKLDVYKAGGGVLKTAGLFHSFVERVVPTFTGDNILIVCSAIAGTTRLLVTIHEAKTTGNEELLIQKTEELREVHEAIIKDLFHGNLQKALLEFEVLYKKLVLVVCNGRFANQEEEYAHILKFGELMSSQILSLYLQEKGSDNVLVDARTLIKTRGSHSKASILEVESREFIWQHMPTLFENSRIVITQGFIAKDHEYGQDSVISFDGSDTSAAFLAASLNARSMTFLKDVHGVWPPGSQSHILPSMTYGGYEQRFNGASLYPVRSDSMGYLKGKKIITYIRHYDMSQGGTLITD